MSLNQAAVIDTIVIKIVDYFDQLRQLVNDEFTYYVTNVESDEKKINQYIEISIDLQIEPTTPVLGYTKTLQLINENKDSFVSRTFDLIKKIVEGQIYRLQNVSVRVTEFKLRISFVLINP